MNFLFLAYFTVIFINIYLYITFTTERLLVSTGLALIKIAWFSSIYAFHTWPYLHFFSLFDTIHGLLGSSFEILLIFDFLALESHLLEVFHMGFFSFSYIFRFLRLPLRLILVFILEHEITLKYIFYVFGMFELLILFITILVIYFLSY